MKRETSSRFALWLGLAVTACVVALFLVRAERVSEVGLPPAPPSTAGAAISCLVQDNLRPGETLYDLLLRHQVQQSTIVEIGAALKKVIPPDQLWPGDHFDLYLEADMRPSQLDIERSPLERFRLRTEGDSYVAEPLEVIADTLQRTVWGKIDGSLWSSFIGAGARPELIVAFTDIFAWSVDFFRDTRPGDAFGVRFSELSVDGKFVRTGEIVAAFYARANDTLWAFSFVEKGRLKFFDETGQSLQKALLRAPLKYSRVSSGFSRRRLHPVDRVYRPHYGTDYAASRGTPIYAAGDGSVQFAGWKNGLGRCVEIRHPNGYRTVYGHLWKFARGVSAGKAVQQRDVIGYVGKTGNASGYHLHYEVRQGKKPVNPRTLALPAKGPVPEDRLPLYETRRDSLHQLLLPRYGPLLAGIG